MHLFHLAAAALLAAAPLLATAATVTVFDTSLANFNATVDPATATTTTTPGVGTVTTVTGPAASRLSAPVVADAWHQRNVGGNGSVGITTDFARSGNGSAYFAGTGTTGGYKSDLEYFFSTPVAASSVQAMSFDWYRSSLSTTTNLGVHAVMRLLVRGTLNGTAVNGYLVYESIYNGGGPMMALDTWVTENFSYATGNLWATGSLPNSINFTPVDYSRQLDDWDALLGNLSVVGLSIGIGSGWNGGGFVGAIDNVTFTTTSGSTTWNFEVSGQGGTVPVPGTLALLGAGLLALGAARRARRAA